MKFKDLKRLTKTEREKKLKELKLELAKANASKTGTKIRQIKKIIARIHTINTSKKIEEKSSVAFKSTQSLVAGGVEKK